MIESVVTPCDYERILEEETPQAIRIAEYLKKLGVKKVIDVGCGPGNYVEALRQQGIEALGVDIDPRCAAIPNCHVEDVTQKVPQFTAPAVLSLEVGEHIPEEKADAYLRYIVLCNPDTIIFSAAQPGQGGEGHVNCQTKRYWCDKIECLGYSLDLRKTSDFLAYMKDGCHLGWLTQNVMVFKKDEVMAPPEVSESEVKETKPVFNFHLLGLAHLPTTPKIRACAYTQKIVKLARMLKKLGHRVNFYGGEGSEVECDRFFKVLTDKERRSVYGDYDWRKEFFKHDPKDRAHAIFNARAAAEILADKKDDDFLLCPMGNYDQPVAHAVGLRFTVESGIGYSGVFAPFKVWESYGWMNHIYGMTNTTNGSWYDAVIPNYYNPEDFHTGKKGDYHLFMGRLISRKGLSVACEATSKLGIKLVVAGQGDLAHVDGYDLTKYKNVEHVGTVDAEQRADLMAGALAIWVPTWYMSPFEGVHIEAMLCGTPAITTDWGVFPESNVHGVTGYRCRTFNEFLWAAKKAPELNSDIIRQYAIANYSMDHVAEMYQSYFEQLWDLKKAGWYEVHNEPRWNRAGLNITKAKSFALLS